MLGRVPRQLAILLAVGLTASSVAAPAVAQRQAGEAGRTEKEAKGYQAAHLEKPEPIAATKGPTNPQTGLHARVGALPFTGWDLIILGGVTLVLGGTGVLLRRLSVPRAPLP